MAAIRHFPFIVCRTRNKAGSVSIIIINKLQHLLSYGFAKVNYYNQIINNLSAKVLNIIYIFALLIIRTEQYE